ncbi:MAG: LAGLIDADG family homing endonuclease [Promethearchaeota archaeon]
MIRKNQKIWTDNEIKFLQNNTHLKDREIAEHLNRSIYSIRGKRKQYYTKHNASSRYSMEMDFFKIWSNEMAYILGFIFADGFVRRRKTGSELSIKIKDKKLLEEINHAMKSNYPIKSVKTPKGILFSLSVYKKEVINDLYKLGVTSRKSSIIQFPDIPLAFVNHFIRGYFDGDGNTGIVKNSLIIEFTSGSNKFLRKLKQILETLDIESSLYKLKRKNIVYSLKILAKGRKFFFQFLYKDATIFLERKYKVMKYYFENIYSKLKIMSCIDCGSEFQKRSNNHKRCASCKSIAIKNSYRRYYYRNREKKLVSNNQRYYKKKNQLFIS